MERSQTVSLRRLFGMLRIPFPYRERITADKRLRYASPKLPSATSFIHKTLYEIALRPLKVKIREVNSKSETIE